MKKKAKVMENKLAWLGFLGFFGILGWGGQPQLGVFLLFFFFFYFAKVPADEMFRQQVQKAGLRALYVYLAASVMMILYMAGQNLAASSGRLESNGPGTWNSLQTDFMAATFSWTFVITVSFFVFTLMYYTYREKKALEEMGTPLNKEGIFGDLRDFITDKPGWCAVTVYFLVQMLMIPISLALTFVVPIDGDLYSIVSRMALTVVIIFVFCEFFPFSLLGFKRQGFKYGLLWGMPAILLIGILQVWISGKAIFEPVSDMAPLLGSMLFSVAYMLLLAFCNEVLCRGLILNILMEGWGHSRRGVYQALLFSATMFGLLVGLSNLVYMPPLSALGIGIGVFLLSIFMGALYLRTGNLWVTMIVYACGDIIYTIWNFLTIEGYSISYSFTNPPEPVEVLKSVSCWVLLLPLALWLMRGIKPRPPVIIQEPEVNGHAENPA